MPAYKNTAERVEGLLYDCLEAYKEDPEQFTDWEENFLISLEEKEAEKHFTDRQISKLEQIWKKCFEPD